MMGAWYLVEHTHYRRMTMRYMVADTGVGRWRKRGPPHMGHIGASAYQSDDGGLRLMRSAMYARNCHGFADHPAQKPIAILQPLIEYSCRPGGTVYVPFAGVGSELVTARFLGRKAIGVEINERYCEMAATRLSSDLPLMQTHDEEKLE